MSTVAETLRAFGPGTLVVRAVGAVCGALGAASPTPYAAVGDAVAALAPGSAKPSTDDAVSVGILALGAAVDAADRELARRAPLEGSELAQAQTGDAVLKLLTIAAIAHRVGGDARLLELPSGRVLATTWAAVDVALPLGGVDLRRLLAAHQPSAATLLAAVVGESALEGVPARLAALVPRLQAEVDRTAAAVDAVARALAPYVPGLVPADPSGAMPPGAAETIAVQTDRLPIYKWLAARIAVEHAVLPGGR